MNKIMVFEIKNFFELLPDAHTVAKPNRNVEIFDKKSPVCGEAQDETKANKLTVIIPNNYSCVKKGFLK